MEISERAWEWYISRLRRINEAAAESVKRYIIGFGHLPETSEEINSVIKYAYGVSTKYGEAAASLAARMYDQIAEMSGVKIAPALPAEVPDIHEVAKTVMGTLKTQNEEVISSSIARLVKRTGVDTTMQNALRDGCEWAWIPHGDTCAFCIALASRGWQKASRKAVVNGHAEHIHANCDCTFAVRFDSSTEVEGYDPRKYREMYDNAGGYTSNQRINSLRREFYEQNKDRINAQKRDLYARTKALNSSAAEELNVPNKTNRLNFAMNQIELDEVDLGELSEDWYLNKLTDEEKARAAMFDSYNFTLDPNREKDTKILEDAISKFRLPAPITTYRGVSENEFFDMMYNFGSDGLKTTEIKGTSIDLGRAEAFARTRGGWMFEYNIKPGRNGAYFDKGVPGSSEKQFVINRNVKYNVKSVDQKKKRIVIEIG